MSQPQRGRYYRSVDDRRLAGVCGGLAEYLNVDSKLVRVATVVLGLMTGGAVVVGYVLLMVLVPEKGAEED
jgi:phage shock protein C